MLRSLADATGDPLARRAIAAGAGMSARQSALRLEVEPIFELVSRRLRNNIVQVLDDAERNASTPHEAAVALAQSRVREAMRLKGRLPLAVELPSAHGDHRAELLAVVDRVEVCELVGMRLDPVGELADQRRALERRRVTRVTPRRLRGADHVGRELAGRVRAAALSLLCPALLLRPG